MIKTLLLTNGLEIIADVELLADTVRLNKPFKIETAFIPQQGPKGIHIAAMPSMVPLIATSAQTFVDLPLASVVCQLDTIKSTAEAYFQRTTGFALASAGDI